MKTEWYKKCCGKRYNREEAAFYGLAGHCECYIRPDFLLIYLKINIHINRIPFILGNSQISFGNGIGRMVVDFH